MVALDIDDVNIKLSDRELLLLSIEKLAALNSKFDEFRIENISKYDSLCKDLKELEKTHQDDMGKVNHKLSKQDGAIAFIYFAIAVGTLVIQLIK